MIYDYDAFCEALARRDGRRCYVRVLIDRAGVDIDRQVREVLACDGPLDGHHLIGKQRLRSAWQTYVRAVVDGTAPEGHGFEGKALSDVLEDPRNGILACRRHHDLSARALLRLFRDALPLGCEEFARELGIEWSIERDYPARAAA